MGKDTNYGSVVQNPGQGFTFVKNGINVERWSCKQSLLEFTVLLVWKTLNFTGDSYSNT